MTDSWGEVAAPEAVASLAPDAWRSWQQLDAAFRAADVADFREAGAELGLVAFAEQFTIDVTGITDEQRASLTETLGAASFEFVQAVFVADFSPRAEQALDDLFGADPAGWPEPDGSLAEAEGIDAGPTAIGLWPALEDFMDAVIAIRALDPVTREVVRLRGARQHDCRLCKSRRSSEALDAGADDALFEAIDHAADSDLSDRHKAAIALVDAMIWQPANIETDVLDDVRANFTPVEAIDLVLDVMRNAMNKIAVALAADTPNVTEGVEIYAVDPH